MRLHRYLFMQYLQLCLLVLTSLIMVVWLNQTLKLLELVVNKGAPLIDFLILSVLAAPLWMLEAAPIALFIAILWVFNKIQSDRELVVMQAVGVSTAQFARAPLILAVSLTCLMVLNSVCILPSSFGEFKLRQSDLRNAIPKILLQDRVFVDISPKLTIYIDERETSTVVRNVFIQDAREAPNITTLTASKGTFTLSEGKPVLILETGERTQTGSDGTASASLYFDSYKLFISSDIAAQGGKRTIDMNEDSISNLLNPETAIAEQYAPQRVAYGHYRILAPFMPLALAFVALIGLSRGRLRDEFARKRLWGIILAAFIVQIGFITARSLTVSLPYLWPLMYLMIALPIIIGLAIIFRPAFQQMKEAMT